MFQREREQREKRAEESRREQKRKREQSKQKEVKLHQEAIFGSSPDFWDHNQRIFIGGWSGDCVKCQEQPLYQIYRSDEHGMRG